MFVLRISEKRAGAFSSFISVFFIIVIWVLYLKIFTLFQG